MCFRHHVFSLSLFLPPLKEKTQYNIEGEFSASSIPSAMILPRIIAFFWGGGNKTIVIIHMFDKKIDLLLNMVFRSIYNMIVFRSFLKFFSLLLFWGKSRSNYAIMFDCRNWPKQGCIQKHHIMRYYIKKGLSLYVLAWGAILVHVLILVLEFPHTFEWQPSSSSSSWGRASW